MNRLGPRRVPGAGNPAALGATPTAHGVNFAVYSETASAVFVCLFDAKGKETHRFECDTHAGPVHAALIAGVGAGQRYGLRADGPYEPKRALWFDPERLLVDPYAKSLDRPFVLAPELNRPRGVGTDTAAFVPKGIVVDDAFEPARPLGQPPGLIYELNVRGFTKLHPKVPRLLRGTVAGLTSRKVLDHLQRIGVDTVELMPVAAFIDDQHLPALGLTNAWGYNPITYFAPDPRLMPGGLAELRALTDFYRKHGISVVLDVVYNHTGESDVRGPIVSMKGLDAKTYYCHTETDDGLVLVNDAGTGNVLACDHPAVQQLVIASLRHWIEQAGVSGFRFDLAPILARRPGFDADAAMLAAIKADPVVGQSLLIAEPWDPGPGGYQIGQFGQPFLEWNDKYRDDVRCFWRGDDWKLGALAGRLAGSAEVFNRDGRGPAASVNFLAAHDGFTLMDLVSFHDRHNEANGEQNRDGHAHNFSWNCGAEGATDEPAVIAARRRDVRALLATLFVSRGTPMLGQGDELGRSQQGNNNAYAQDNAITWVDWAHADEDLIAFTSALSALRKAHPALRENRFLTGLDVGGWRDVAWLHPEGSEMVEADWHRADASVLGMRLVSGEDDVIVWLNRRHDAVDVRLPEGEWRSALVSAGDAVDVSAGALELPGRCVVVLTRAETDGAA